MLIGWRVASNIKTETVLDAIEMARWCRGKNLPGLRCCADPGSQFASVRYVERLAVIGTVAALESLVIPLTTLRLKRLTGITRLNSFGDQTTPGPRKRLKN